MAAAPRLNAEIGEVSGTRQKVTMGLWLYQYLLGVGRNPVGTVVAATVGASPYTYVNTSGFTQDAIVAGGTVSNVSFSRGGLFYTVPAGTVTLSPGDSLRVTYTVAPNVTIIPR